MSSLGVIVAALAVVAVLLGQYRWHRRNVAALALSTVAYQESLKDLARLANQIADSAERDPHLGSSGGSGGDLEVASNAAGAGVREIRRGARATGQMFAPGSLGYRLSRSTRPHELLGGPRATRAHIAMVGSFAFNLYMPARNDDLLGLTPATDLARTQRAGELFTQWADWAHVTRVVQRDDILIADSYWLGESDSIDMLKLSAVDHVRSFSPGDSKVGYAARYEKGRLASELGM